MIKFLFPLLAVITCQNNLDGSWTCYDDSPLPSLPDSGIVDDGSGNYTCTNCVNMSPAECYTKRHELSNQAYSSYSDLDIVIHEVYLAITNLSDLVYNNLRSFVPCPWTYISESRSGLTSNGYPSPNSNFSIENRNYYLNTVLPSWTSSTNFQFISVNPMPYDSSLGYVQLFSAHNSLVGIWQSSYETANRCADDIEVHALNVLSDTAPFLVSARDNLIDLESNIQTNITCEACELGSSSGSSGGGSSGGGTGTDQGCMDCYLNYLRSLDSNVLDIRNSLVSYLHNVGNYTNELLRILRSINTNVQGISNHVARLDDYITDDFRSSFSNVVNSVVVISQQVDTVQRQYYEAFGRSNDHKDKDDQSYTLASMSEAVFDGPSGFDEGEFLKLDWQARQELLLYRIVNPPETNIVQDVQELFERNINTSKQTVENSASDLQTAVGGFVETFRTVQSTIDNFASVFGGSVQLPESVTLLSEGSWLGEEPLVIPINPTVAGFSNLLFFSIWYTVAFVVGFRLSVAVWGIVSAVAVSVYKMFGKDD